MLGFRKPNVITSIEYRNFRVLENTVLPLGGFNLLLGPNGSGKTTAVRSLLVLGDAAAAMHGDRPAARQGDLAGARARFVLGGGFGEGEVVLSYDKDGNPGLVDGTGGRPADAVIAWLAGFKGYVLDPAALARSVPKGTPPVLASDGSGLAAVLADLRTTAPERWNEFLSEFRRILPEAADVVAGQTTDGKLAFSGTTTSGHSVPASNLSQGTLVVLALLAIVLAPERPTGLCIEELERGIHPRLLRDVRDLLYRMSFPADCGESAAAVQVVATTHSPYVLDLFVDTPEDVILATKEAGAATFKRLTEIPELEDLLREGRLGDLWYSGILGGVL